MATVALALPAIKIKPAGVNLTTAGTSFSAGDTVTCPNDGRSCLVFQVSSTGGTASLKKSGVIAADVAITLTASKVILVGPFDGYGPLVTVVTTTATGTVETLALPAGQRNGGANAFETDSTQLDSV